jgi:hypothetical protein
METPTEHQLQTLRNFRIAGLVTAGLSVAGVTYVLICVYKRKYFSRTSSRFPLYLAFFDLIWALITSTDNIAYLSGSPLTGSNCKALGTLSFLFVRHHCTMCMCLALSFVYCVTFKRPLKTGKWDYKLIILAFIIEAPFLFTGVATNVYGPAISHGMTIRCYMDNTNIAVLLCIYVIPQFVTTMITMCCLFWVWHTIYSYVRLANRYISPMSFVSSASSNRVQMVNRRIFFYTVTNVTACAIPASVAIILLAMSAPPFVLTILMTWSININGIINAFVFRFVSEKPIVEGSSYNSLPSYVMDKNQIPKATESNYVSNYENDKDNG